MNDQPTTEPELVDADWCPLVLLALEIGEDPTRLASRLGALVVSDDLGFRSVTAATARSVVADHHERQAAAVERRRRQRAEQLVRREAQLVDREARRLERIARAEAASGWVVK